MKIKYLFELSYDYASERGIKSIEKRELVYFCEVRFQRFHAKFEASKPIHICN
jgi:hypothetical protein